MSKLQTIITNSLLLSEFYLQTCFNKRQFCIRSIDSVGCSSVRAANTPYHILIDIVVECSRPVIQSSSQNFSFMIRHICIVIRKNNLHSSRIRSSNTSIQVRVLIILTFYKCTDRSISTTCLVIRLIFSVNIYIEILSFQSDTSYCSIEFGVNLYNILASSITAS